MSIYNRLYWATALFFCFNPLIALNVQANPLEGIKFDRPVIDQAKLLSPTAFRTLDNLLRSFSKKSDAQLGVITLTSLEGDSIESVSIKIADLWKLGGEATDKGIFILVAKEDRQVRIEVGQGLEGDIPDAYAKRVVDQYITPAFKQGNFAQGIVTGSAAIISYIDPKFDFKGNSTSAVGSSTQPKKKHWLVQVIMFLLFLFLIFTPTGRFILIAMLLSGRGGRYGGGGGGLGGGGFSGGGGGFSGGGASGSW